jgi:protein SCO1/2
VAPIFITVDPERDTEKVMGDYVANFAPDMVGLTGKLDAVEKVEHEYHVYAKKHPEVDGSYSMDHSSIVYLMDRDGKYRAIFSGETTAAQIVDGLKKQL